MSERDKPVPSPRDSPSASLSSRDALDSASVRELSSAIHGMRQSIDDSRELARAEARKGEFRERMMVNAIEKNTAAVRGLAGVIHSTARLNTEVTRDGQRAITKQLEDVTGEFQLIKQREVSVKEQAKALHFWLFVVSVVLGVVGESGVIHEPHWQKLCVGLAMALGGLAVKAAAGWQSEDVRSQLKGGK